MRFVVDAQLPPALAGMIRESGHDAEHVSKVGLLAAADPSIWDYALQHGAAIVTKDEDFPHRLGQSTHLETPAIVSRRAGNVSRRALLDWFALLLPRITILLEEGERLVEVR